MYNREIYVPRDAFIDKVTGLTSDTKLFKIRFSKRQKGLSDEHEFLPGQFVQVSVFGAGEVPISIASSPAEKGYMELSVRKVGEVTSALHSLRKGQRVGIRGPYGNSFPIEDTGYKRFLFVGGGCGLAPLRSLVRYVSAVPDRYPELAILYGARTSKDILFRDELDSLKRSKRAKIGLSVDCGPKDAGCSVGLVTTLFKRFDDLSGTLSFICGPPIMLTAVVKELLSLNVREENIILSLERYMKCGVGKCGHCYIKDKYVCTDGPIFSYRQLKELGGV